MHRCSVQQPAAVTPHMQQAFMCTPLWDLGLAVPSKPANPQSSPYMYTAINPAIFFFLEIASKQAMT